MLLKNLLHIVVFAGTGFFFAFDDFSAYEKYDKNVRDGLSKVCNVNFDDNSSAQLARPFE